MLRTTFLVAGVLALLTGCNAPDKRLNAPPHGRAEETSDLQGTFTYMTDNALLADMVVSDQHFLPHRAVLNDLGTLRLSRLASLMEAYGGAVRYSTDETDEALVRARLRTIVDFLAEAGIDTTQQVVKRDMSGGEGIAATEAVLIRANEGVYNPRKKSAGATGTGTGTGSTGTGAAK